VTAAPHDLAGRDHWDEVYGTVGAITSGWRPAQYETLLLERLLLSSIRDAGARTVLEIGCGSSVWLPHLAREGQVTVAGLDYSPRGCELARKRLAAEGVAGTIYCGDLFTASAGDIGQYDLLFSLGVVEHFTDLPGVVRALARFVKPGGRLLTEVPHLWTRGGIWSIHGLLSWLWQPELLAKHHTTTRRQLERACRAAGLHVVESGYLGTFSLNIVAWEIYHRWPRVARVLLPTVRRLEVLADRVLRKVGGYRGIPGLSPFMYVIATKPEIARA
jgi:2-polyprenyl-3-methyl-5-hydroxy-6-metoxy-1,4-benzoquinol methylase